MVTAVVPEPTSSLISGEIGVRLKLVVRRVRESRFLAYGTFCSIFTVLGLHSSLRAETGG